MAVLSRALVALSLVCAGCAFSPDLGDGTLHCGDGGSCPPGQSCAADGLCRADPTTAPAPDLAPCRPIDCKHAVSGGHACDTLDDGCGGTIDCGKCPNDETCGAELPNVCG